jgi:chromosome segregation protein
MVKLHSIELCGFRGAKNLLTIEFSSGFTILTGTNGAGKSTILDAVEFALIGVISKYEDTTGEKGEEAADYEWWRGKGQPADRFVRLRLETEYGVIIEITRRPQGTEILGADELAEVLCDTALNPESTIEGLCRTSFIRDELIARHSVDLPETERFAFVRSAVGAQNTAKVDNKLQKAREEVRRRIALAERGYTVARTRVEESIERLSSNMSEVEEATVEDGHALRRSLDLPEDASVTQVLQAIDREVAKRRSAVDALSRIYSRAAALANRRTEFERDGGMSKSTEMARNISVMRQSLQRSAQGLAEAEADLERVRSGQEVISSLAELVKAGKAVGLRDGTCPLCGSVIEEGRFSEHLIEIEVEVSRFGKEIAAVVERRNELRTVVMVSRNQIDSLQTTYESLRAEIDALDRQRAALQEEFVAIIPEAGGPEPEQIRPKLDRAMAELSALERERRAFAAPGALEEVLVQEEELKARRDAASEAEKSLSRLQRVDDRLKEAQDAATRFSAEAVEERLAAIKPLFTELYLRLRPHIDWKTVNYAVRGDLRKFLSLRVDDGLNMKFLFSSGQRRAAGLAFLISVALSRPWCRLRALILDDPVQHVDDFRAIHLVETLAAIRTSGFQILCAVEDPSLAELLCRRLRSSYKEGGSLVHMKYVSGQGTELASVLPIQPLGIIITSAAS